MNKETQTAYERVLQARSKERAGIMDYIEALFTDFVELKGDRLGKEDESIVGGIAMFHKIPVTVIGHRKGKSTEENVKYNFGTQYYDDFVLRLSGKNTIYDLANGGGKSVLMLLLLQNMLQEYYRSYL